MDSLAKFLFFLGLLATLVALVGVVNICLEFPLKVDSDLLRDNYFYNEQPRIDQRIFASSYVFVSFNQDPSMYTGGDWWDIGEEFYPYVTLIPEVNTSQVRTDICVVYVDNVSEHCPDNAVACAKKIGDVNDFPDLNHLPYYQFSSTCQGHSGIYLPRNISGDVAKLLLMHEMLHALGLVNHSQNREDLFYPALYNITDRPFSDEVITRLSALYPETR
jgi:hypothetical protein